MTQTINVQEVATYQKDKQFYLDQGYPLAVAEQYALDHQFASKSKKFKEL